MTTTAQPIQIRADLTDDEWLDIRKEALDRKVTTSKYVGDLIRAGRECIAPPQPKGEVA